MNRELYDRAVYPQINACSAAMLLSALADAGREQALQALTAALAAPQARELADALAGPLAEAQKAAAGPLAAVDEAREALAKEQSRTTGRLAKFWASARRNAPDDREAEPSRDTPEAERLRAALAEAEAVAMPFRQRADYHAEQVRGLLAAPAPDPAVLAVLAAAMCGCTRDTEGA